jgi:beta-glucosidase
MNCSHGLSYTSFELSRVTVEGRCVLVDVSNKGSLAGSKTVQVYISAPKSLISRPIRELHGFEKVYIEPGGTSRLKIHIDQYAGSLWDESEDNWLLEKGEYEVLVGTSLSSAQKAGRFVVQHKSHWLGLRALDED